MPVDIFPSLHIPVVVVATFYPGMPPLEMEADITTRSNASSRSVAISSISNRARCPRAERTLGASRGELELAEKRYAAGLSDIVELEDAQRNYTSDDAAYTNSLYASRWPRRQSMGQLLAR